jgi:hypothetical protein
MCLAQLNWIALTVASRTVELDTAMRALAGRPASERLAIGLPVKIRFAEEVYVEAKRATEICEDTGATPAAQHYTIALLCVINKILATARDDEQLYRAFLTDQIANLQSCIDDIEGAIRFSQLVDQRTGVEEWITSQ